MKIRAHVYKMPEFEFIGCIDSDKNIFKTFNLKEDLHVEIHLEDLENGVLIGGARK